MSIKADWMDKLVDDGQLKSYLLDVRNDTGSDPYMQLELVFPNGFIMIVIPEGRHPTSGVDRIGLFNSYRNPR